MTTSTDKTQHTPAPWVVGPSAQVYSADGRVCIMPYHTTTHANAARIVECVNGYDAARSRCAALEAALRGVIDASGEYDIEGCLKARAIARAALRDGQ